MNTNRILLDNMYIMPMQHSRQSLQVQYVQQIKPHTALQPTPLPTQSVEDCSRPYIRKYTVTKITQLNKNRGRSGKTVIKSKNKKIRNLTTYALFKWQIEAHFFTSIDFKTDKMNKRTDNPKTTIAKTRKTKGAYKNRLYIPIVQIKAHLAHLGSLRREIKYKPKPTSTRENPDLSLIHI